jgi:hypothetical protein
MKKMLFGLFVVLALSACTEKEFNDGANSIGNDVGNLGKKVFEVNE